MTVFTHATYDPIARMNAAKDMHRARGTTGGKGNGARAMTATEIRARDDGMACHELALANVAAIWNEFRSWSQQERTRPLGDCAFDEIPF